MNRPTYDELMDEVLVLRGRLAMMQNVDQATILKFSTSLTMQEARVLMALMDRPMATREHIYVAAMEHDNGDGPIIKAVDVVVCKIRRKLRAEGLNDTISNVWGQGYSLSDGARAWVSARLAPQQMAAAA